MRWLHDAPFDFEEQAVWPLKNVEENADKLTTVCSYENDTNTSVRFGPNHFTTYCPLGNLSCGRAL